MSNENKNAYSVLEAISKWHTGELSVGTLAARLEIEPSKLLAALEANHICNRVGVLIHPELSHVTTLTLAFIYILSHEKRLKNLTATVQKLESEVSRLSSVNRC